jgi:uncharacterized protein (DUF1810 family)
MQQPLPSDPYNLQRFVDAQDTTITQVYAELGAGRKLGCWMWYIFPQIEGLGRSTNARIFAMSSLTEAKAYLGHPVLGARIRKCTKLVNRIEGRSIDDIFYFPDNLKFWSSITLFAHATSENEMFLEAAQKYFGGKFDALTISRLSIKK